jgi:hypothetical protein
VVEYIHYFDEIEMVVGDRNVDGGESAQILWSIAAMRPLKSSCFRRTDHRGAAASMSADHRPPQCGAPAASTSRI